MKNWRSRFFTLHIKPIPILAYYRDEQKQRSPTQMLFLKGAKVEVRVLLGTLSYTIPSTQGVGEGSLDHRINQA